MIISLIRTVYFLRLKAENTAVTYAGDGPTLGAMATLNLSESSSVPSDETGKALSQAQLSFKQSGSRHLIRHTQHISQCLLTKEGPMQAF